MKITITMDCPTWTEDDAYRFYASIEDIIQSNNFYRSHSSRIIQFDVDGVEYVYEVPKFPEDAPVSTTGRLAGSMRVWGPGLPS